MDVPCEQATTCKDVLGIKIEDQTDDKEIIRSFVDDSFAPVISKITSAGIKIESVCSYAEDNIKVEECDVYVAETLATQGRDIEDNTTSEQVAVKCEHTECSSEIEEVEGADIINSVAYESCVPAISKIASFDIKIESDCSDDEDNIKVEECDVYDPEDTLLATNGRDVEDKTLNEVEESEQFSVKSEQTEASSDVIDRDKLLDNYDIIAHCDQTDDRSNVISRRSDVCDNHLKRTLNSVNINSPKNVLYICDLCNKCFKTKVGIQKHMRVHSGNWPCKDNGSTKHLSSTNHNRIDIGDRYKCDVCTKCFKRKYALYVHQRTHTGEKPYKCDVCMKCFNTKAHLIQHSRKHTGVKPFKCDVCMKCFTSKSYLIIHNKIHTGEKPYKCDVCMKCFITKSHLIMHNKIHTGEKPYKCDVCMKCFITKNQLNRHNCIHTSEKPFKCDVCMKYFNYKSNLTVHNRIHTGEKPYQCDVCMKCFSCKSSLTEHNRIHTGEKLYKCDVCMKCFTSRSSLTKHNRIHTGETPYKCDVCMKCVTTKSYLIIHKKKHTGQKQIQM